MRNCCGGCFGGMRRGRMWCKWWRHEATFLTLNISKTKRWFIVTKLSMMSFDHMSWGVLQICDLENDGANCSIVIKVASVHVVHGLQAHWIGLVQHLWCSLDEVLITCRHCSPFAVDYTMLFSSTAFNHCRCMIVSFIDHLSVTEYYHGEQCKFTAKGHSLAVDDDDDI